MRELQAVGEKSRGPIIDLQLFYSILHETSTVLILLCIYVIIAPKLDNSLKKADVMAVQFHYDFGALLALFLALD